MEQIQALLKRYAHIQAPEKTIREAVIAVVREVVGISLGSEDVDVKKKTIRIHAPSVLKNEIRLHQQDILECLKKELNKDAPTSIL